MWPDRVVTVLLLLAGAVNLLPGWIAFAPGRIPTAYGVSVAGRDSADLTLLLRHRAVLLGLVGLALLCAAFTPSLRIPAVTAGAVSMTSFLAFAHTAPALNNATKRVARIDLAALTLLAAAAPLL